LKEGRKWESMMGKSAVSHEDFYVANVAVELTGGK
jgi:hypothetical protein